MKVPVSILVPIKNEEKNLARCLASVSWASEIFVVDSRSTDASVQIAESFGAKVVQFELKGAWPKKKNWSLENLPFSHEWVFILDADEVMPEGSEEEFRAIVEDPHHPVDGYWINRRFMFMGRWLRHAYYPNWNLRLFRHRLGRYEKLTDSETASGDNEVHEHVVVKGKTGYLKCEMDHFAFPSIDVFVEKHNRYSNWEAWVASDRFLGGSDASLQKGDVGIRRKLKTLSQSLPFRPLLRFLYVYLWQKGFLDGAEGYYFARLHGFYEFLCISKETELEKAQFIRKIAGIGFFSGSMEEALRRTSQGGLVLAPSGPGIAGDLLRDPAYRAAALKAELVLPDSGAMVLAWIMLHAFLPKYRLRRLSGLKYMRALITDPGFQAAGATLWVMPSEKDLSENLTWLRANGFPHLTRADCHLAPIYERGADGTVADPELAGLIERKRPRFVILNIGGGTQEQLGWWLRCNLSYKPAIICTGAAIAFLSGRQVNIPTWADAIYLGWLLRCLTAPGKFVPRYWEARRIFWVIFRYGSRLPDVKFAGAGVMGRRRMTAAGVRGSLG